MVASENRFVLITASPIASQCREDIAEGNGGVSGAVPILFSGLRGLQ
jgi:hypothetical protein